MMSISTGFALWVGLQSDKRRHTAVRPSCRIEVRPTVQHSSICESQLVAQFGTFITDGVHLPVVGKTVGGLTVANNEMIEQIDVHKGTHQGQGLGQLFILA